MATVREAIVTELNLMILYPFGITFYLYGAARYLTHLKSSDLLGLEITIILYALATVSMNAYFGAFYRINGHTIHSLKLLLVSMLTCTAVWLIGEIIYQSIMFWLDLKGTDFEPNKRTLVALIIVKEPIYIQFPIFYLLEIIFFAKSRLFWIALWKIVSKFVEFLPIYVNMIFSVMNEDDDHVNQLDIFNNEDEEQEEDLFQTNRRPLMRRG